MRSSVLIVDPRHLAIGQLVERRARGAERGGVVGDVVGHVGRIEDEHLDAGVIELALDRRDRAAAAGVEPVGEHQQRLALHAHARERLLREPQPGDELTRGLAHLDPRVAQRVFGGQLGQRAFEASLGVGAVDNQRALRAGRPGPGDRRRDAIAAVDRGQRTVDRAIDPGRDLGHLARRRANRLRVGAGLRLLVRVVAEVVLVALDQHDQPE